jgi:hypothetical protein
MFEALQPSGTGEELSYDAKRTVRGTWSEVCTNYLDSCLYAQRLVGLFSKLNFIVEISLTDSYWLCLQNLFYTFQRLLRYSDASQIRFHTAILLTKMLIHALAHARRTERKLL